MAVMTTCPHCGAANFVYVSENQTYPELIKCQCHVDANWADLDRCPENVLPCGGEYAVELQRVVTPSLYLTEAGK